MKCETILEHLLDDPPEPEAQEITRPRRPEFASDVVGRR